MAETLPLEILRNIFDYVDVNLAPYACVCRQWQVAVEQFLFASLLIDSADLEDFRQIVLSSHSASRCFHMRRLYFKVILPEYSVAARGHYENRNDRDGNSKVFTQAITSLFEILSSWPDVHRHQLSLEICAESPSDWDAETSFDAQCTRLEEHYAYPRQELLHRRYERSYLQLTEITLPNVECVTSLDILGYGQYRNILTGSVSEMVARLPRLDTINAELRDSGRRGAAASDNLDDSHSATWPSSLRHLRLKYEASQRYGMNFPPPANPHLCLALHRLTQQLKTVELSQIMIDPELFWPANANDTTPSWPNLIKIDISYKRARNMRYGRLQTFAGEQHLSSGRPSSKQLDELYLAAGRAAQYMPRLNSMNLDISISNSSGSQHYFKYDATSGTATWRRSSDYRPPNEVQEAWDIAARGHGHAQMYADFRSTEDSASA
ncbi:hypothetical protein N7516_007028 [Penicillium verrucosum]|uniref:uncharacterized protein n=1 Tax=Penicillium verrucosum TaxID=60171 RepID=UPI00254533B1|nr:uncharacterized protein N7516_007028 [Penicillium verrucosum]KAJ5932539.1 hypothetical protein N7516_007028 [Penicillium verrucosum]